ncbi:hypothetical protein EI163_17335 [Halomonas sp. FME16]|uniref:Uncharacterized protein n=1 Tax=Halomonas citrativorans TaxID=2742612 RepID=A0ABR9FFW2_9GAMM|nr:hypothetical protein [Halomonas citrativorans]
MTKLTQSFEHPRLQRMKRQLRVQDLMLSALTTIDQVPALALALSQNDPGDVSAFLLFCFSAFLLFCFSAFGGYTG